MPIVGLMVSSYKGYKFLEKVIRNKEIAWVASYEDNGTKFRAYYKIKELCKANNVRFVPYENIDYDAEKIFIVGWKYMIKEVKDNCVVMHDSLLPACRGFCPTVTAIINDLDMGVTALLPSDEMDAGEILTQHSIGRYNRTDNIKEVYDKLSEAYFRCYSDVVAGERTYEPTIKKVTYSIWRDEEDYYINWRETGERIYRKIMANGWPYDGAKTRFNGETIEILDVAGWEGAIIETPSCGKVFKKNGKEVAVTCLDGFVTLTLSKELPKLRCRLG